VLPSLHVLAELGANVNVPNHCSATPLHAAASTGAIEALRTLIQLGAHLTALDSLGASALHYSVERCQVWTIAKRKPRMVPQCSSTSQALH
jgi:ankyrin repeat protein